MSLQSAIASREAKKAPYLEENKKSEALYNSSKESVIDYWGWELYNSLDSESKTRLIADEMRKRKKEGIYRENKTKTKSLIFPVYSKEYMYNTKSIA
jgi:hypothetical protein